MDIVDDDLARNCAIACILYWLSLPSMTDCWCGGQIRDMILLIFDVVN